MRSRRTPAPPWHPAALPPSGFRLEHDGAVFEAVQAVPHDRSRYLNVWLVTWRTNCAGCGVGIKATSTAAGWQKLRSKWCEQCRSAGLDTPQAAREADGTP